MKVEGVTLAEADRAAVMLLVAEKRLRQALSLVRERHADFGSTFAAKKLAEAHGLSPSRETLRKWMSEEGPWRPKGRRKARVHQSRPRRPRVGELVQVDGSPHDWFEGRGRAAR